MNGVRKEELLQNELASDEEAAVQRGSDNNQCLKASDVFLHGLTSEVKRDDVGHIVDTQKHMLSRFEKTNEMLLNFNVLSSSRYTSTDLDFKSHIHMLLDTKKDLDLVFKRIRLLKNKLSVIYPAAFKACTHIYEVPDDEEEDECDMKDKSSESAVDRSRSVSCEDMSVCKDMSDACSVDKSRIDESSSSSSVVIQASVSETSDTTIQQQQQAVIVAQTVAPNYKTTVCNATDTTSTT
jgi:hypothetical protein